VRARVTAVSLVGVVLAAVGGAAAQEDGGTPVVPVEPSPGRAEVWAVGDAATPTSAARAVARMIRRARPDRFLYLGDVYDKGTPAEFRAYYDPLYGPLGEITDPTPGNHEWGRRFSGYYPYWRAQKGRRQAPWTVTTVAGWEIVSLNSEAAHDSGSRQLAWLRRVLARRPGDCRIAFWHRPRYSAGFYGDASDVAPLWDALKGRARAVLSGQDHNLQRLRPVQGIVQYVAGAGGQVRYEIDEDDPRLAFGTDSRYGALRMVLEPGNATFEFRGVRGRLLDRSRTTCTTPG
jgi:Calcineurin-like phosphoesterase